MILSPLLKLLSAHLLTDWLIRCRKFWEEDLILGNLNHKTKSGKET